MVSVVLDEDARVDLAKVLLLTDGSLFVAWNAYEDSQYSIVGQFSLKTEFRLPLKSFMRKLSVIAMVWN
ncbi:hypothetical protein GCM10017044_28770 [Kordiimonas sediminis]|uniref:Uncharacterized protein n=1 Tax=Kordiimonas sediminis TaxID=1735581 RepID=A0A919EBL0_9PROT|nr:hypothetical protein GCM10017044_28770 [Kordiimonas sediminis]